MKPTKEEIDNTVKELVVALTQEADAKSAFSDIVSTFKKEYEDFDTSWLTTAAKKQFKKERNQESYEREREKTEMAYEIVDGLEK